MAVAARTVAEGERDVLHSQVDTLKQQLSARPWQKQQRSSSSSPGRSGSGRGATTPATADFQRVWFLLASTQAWMEAAETIGGQPAAGEGLVRFQLPGTRPNMPFDSVLPHVGAAIESHARVQAHYTPGRVVATATDPSFRMPMERQAHWRGARGVTAGKQHAATSRGAKTSRARCDARH